MKKILFVASEGMPFIKSGGLADVAGSLPQAVNGDKYQVRIVLPLYMAIRKKYPDLKKECEFQIYSGIINKTAEIYTYDLNGILYYFIAQDQYFGRDNLYGYDDDGERFAFFDKAVMEMIGHVNFIPDIIHCNDWQTAMIPVLYKEDGYRNCYPDIKTVYTIHNLAYQGAFSKDMMSCFNLDRKLYRNGRLRFGNGMNFAKSALVYSDKITTVSQNYANEIMTEEYGEKLQDVLRSRQYDLTGIVNGIDMDMWNPETDRLIAANYSKTSIKNKTVCKLAIQKELGLREAKDVLLIAVVSRLAYQKGINLIIDKLQNIMNQDVQLIVLGTGEKEYEQKLTPLEYVYPHRAVCYKGYNEELSHRVYAGADMLLMPSLFEPCGLSQLIALRYGTLPLVRETGGLRDTVVPYNQFDKTGYGFTFRYFSGDDMIYILAYAIETYYYRRKDWDKMIKRAMALDNSWIESSRKYISLYESM